AAEAERQKKEKAIEDAFKQAEAEARALEELKKKEEAELAVLNALASEKAAANVLDAMTTRITRAWRRPVAFKGGLEVYLRMSLASNGELVDVRVVKTSGDVLFDRSALTAVQRAAPFDEVKQFDAATFEEKFRSLTVKFRPED
ncbi:MAG: cell envelope integrity protein TolA, partial [Gammaproteobacteria bacterium]|nr:cell envelope integrity protein TolA [Gammaproteobacteria bacterium]